MRAGWFSVLAVALCVFVSACQSDAVNRDRENSFLTAGDMTKMTDQMAQAIVADSDVARIIAQKPMIIVMKPIENATNEIIRPGQKEMYVHRVRVLLSREAELRKKFVFVLNRADYERLQREEGFTAEKLGDREDRVQPEYALWGTFYANTNVSSKTRSDTYLCVFKLTDLATGVVIWEGKYETAKQIEKSFLD